MAVPSDPRSVSNRILSALPTEEYRRLTERAEAIPLKVRHIFYEAGQLIPFVYFLNDGLGSVVTTMAEGTSIEVMVVGREGMVGLPALESGSATVSTDAFMQVAGDGIKISSAAVREEFSRGGHLQRLLLGYIQFSLVQISQSAACNRLHDLEERLARWLLMVSDRLQSNEFILTHEFLSQMLGTRRASVTLAAGTLQRAGLLDYRRGNIKLLDREGMENVTCECYPIVKEARERFQTRQSAG
jgi:CRP-like cAMP-binding protein